MPPNPLEKCVNDDQYHALVCQQDIVLRDEELYVFADSSSIFFDTEPLPSVPDAWAQGSVPYQALPPVSPTMSEHDTEVTSISRISNPEVLEDLPSTLNETGTVEEAETETDRRQDKKIEEAEEKEDEIENNNNEEIIEVSFLSGCQ